MPLCIYGAIEGQEEEIDLMRHSYLRQHLHSISFQGNHLVLLFLHEDQFL